MIKENIYVAINHNDEIQWVKGSSSKTRYFRTDKYSCEAEQWAKSKAESGGYEVKVITRGNCMMCGKELTEGLFFCKECTAKAGSEE